MPSARAERAIVLAGLVEEPPGAEEDGAKHRFGELAGGSVLLAGMEGADENRLAGTGDVLLVMTENKIRTARDFSLIAKDREIDVESHASQRDNNFQVTEQFQVFFQIRPAVADLSGERLVVRRSAADSGADVSIDERQPVVAGHAGGLRGEASFVKSPIKEVA